MYNIGGTIILCSIYYIILSVFNYYKLNCSITTPSLQMFRLSVPFMSVGDYTYYLYIYIWRISKIRQTYYVISVYDFQVI